MPKKMFKLSVKGKPDDFNIGYKFSENFGARYDDCDYEGNEQDKYKKFCEDLEANGDIQPINIKVNMTTQSTGRVLTKKDILKIIDVNEFIKRLAK